MVIGLNSDYAFPLEEGMAIPPVFLPGEYHGQRSLVGYSPWGCTELDTTEATQQQQYFENYPQGKVKADGFTDEFTKHFEKN